MSKQAFSVCDIASYHVLMSNSLFTCCLGCRHGTCSEPFTCHCLDGWSGSLCDQPVCQPGCDQLHGSCK